MAARSMMMGFPVGTGPLAGGGADFLRIEQPQPMRDGAMRLGVGPSCGAGGANSCGCDCECERTNAVGPPAPDCAGIDVFYWFYTLID